MTAPVKFENPPVAEVVCGVMFNTLPGFKAAHVGLFWQTLRNEFPRIEDVAPINVVMEAPISAAPGVQYEVASIPPLRRTWFLRTDGTALIQVQEDRFLFNWKRVQDDVCAYPSYDVVIREFEKHLEHFKSFLATEGIGGLVYRQFELTYVNIIGPQNGLAEVGLGGVLVDHRFDGPRARFLPEPELYKWSSSYPLPNEAGRLHIVAKSALRREKAEKVMRLEVIARGIPRDASEAGRRPWFDMAHEWITRGFADSTANALHKTWRRVS